MAYEIAMTPQEIDAITARIQERLDEFGDPVGVKLVVDKDDTKWDDGWLYVAVANRSPGKIRASEYAEWYSVIERELRKDEVANILLVPVSPDI